MQDSREVNASNLLWSNEYPWIVNQLPIMKSEEEKNFLQS
jgi:hypothetical protein